MSYLLFAVDSEIIGAVEVPPCFMPNAEFIDRATMLGYDVSVAADANPPHLAFEQGEVIFAAVTTRPDYATL